MEYTMEQRAALILAECEKTPRGKDPAREDEAHAGQRVVEQRDAEGFAQVPDNCGAVVADEDVQDGCAKRAELIRARASQEDHRKGADAPRD